MARSPLAADPEMVIQYHDENDDVQTLAGRAPVTIAAGARLPGTAKLQTALHSYNSKLKS